MGICRLRVTSSNTCSEQIKSAPPLTGDLGKPPTIVAMGQKQTITTLERLTFCLPAA